MIITICGSMSSYGLMVTLKDDLVKSGHIVVLPEPADCRHQRKIDNGKYIDSYRIKIRHNYIKQHYGHIVSGDCVLIANYDKDEIKNYIGGNTFLEMGYAFAHGKPIYLINPIPKNDFYYHEIKAMCPIVLNGNLTKLPIKMAWLSS